MKGDDPEAIRNKTFAIYQAANPITAIKSKREEAKKAAEEAAKGPQDAEVKEAEVKPDSDKKA